MIHVSLNTVAAPVQHVLRVWNRPWVRVGIIGALALVAVVLYMTLGVRGNWGFVLPFRGRKVLAIMVVATAIAISTVMFQTVTNNRILTPSIMGFDALYLLIQTLSVFVLGAMNFALINPLLRFGIEVVLMVLFAGTLFWWLFVKSNKSLHLLVLVGIIFGIMFRSFNNMLQRMLDPVEFAVLQDATFANFSTIDQTLLWISIVIVGGAGFLLWRKHPEFDALALGRDTSVSLGVDYRKVVMLVLAVVTVLVSVATALAGPVTFFGLLVANLAYALVNSPWHRHVLPAAVLLAVLALVGGQVLLERVFMFDTSLSVIIEFVGGLVFIGLLMRGLVR